MNPLLVATATNAIGKNVENGNVEKLANTALKPLKIGLIVIAVIVVGYFAYKAIKNAIDKAKAGQNNNQDLYDNPQTEVQRESNRVARAKQLAARLRAAFNPSGFDWLVNTDGTTTMVVYDVANQMKINLVPFSYVAKAYYAAYNDDLSKRLEKELESTELTKFYAKAGMNGFAGLNGTKTLKPLNYAY
jgi:hypothetical protein